jgi:hypothetical protein
MGNRFWMTVVDAIQVAIALGLFVWFLNWTPRSMKALRKHRLSLLDRPPDAPPVNPSAADPNTESESI